MLKSAAKVAVAYTFGAVIVLSRVLRAERTQHG